VLADYPALGIQLGFDEVRTVAAGKEFPAEHTHTLDLESVGIVDVVCPDEHSPDVANDFAGMFVEFYDT
jgi:hypothetical protein